VSAADFSRIWDPPSELAVEFEGVIPATPALILGPGLDNANIELIEEALPLFSAVSSSTDIPHEDLLHPGRSCTLSANTLLGR
jgi:hypothetical protein